MDAHTPRLQLTGETVVINRPATHAVAQGRFCLENREAVAVRGAVNAAWLEFDSGGQVLLPDLTLCDRELDLPLNQERFTLGAQASLPIQIDFVEPAYEPALGECTAVGLRLEVGGVLLEALSPVEFAHRAD